MNEIIITITGQARSSVEDTVSQITNIAVEAGIPHSNPLVLPVSRFPVPVTEPDVSDHTIINFINLYGCKIVIQANENVLRNIMRTQLPDGVNIEIILKDKSSTDK
jgi:small subunit ribosomal protein S10